MQQGDDGDPQQSWVEETDSVAQMAGEYSEETLSMLRRYKKPEWMDEPSSLDPLEDMEDHVLRGFRIPPTTYDAAQKAAAESVEELQAAKDLHLEPQHEQMVEYRKNLVEGTSLDDVKWLKLRAYHRVMDQQRAMQAELGGPATQQAGEAGRHAAAADADPNSYSEESEWSQDWSSTSYLHGPAARRDLAAFGSAPRHDGGESSHQHAAADPLEEFGQVMINGEPSKWQTWRPVHGYTPEYVEHQRLDKRLRAQQRQRALAFWLPLTAVVGAYVVKGIRRLCRRGGAGGKGKEQVRSKS